MLDPQYLSDVSLDFEKLYAQLEIDILSDIARRIRQNDYSMTSTAEYQKQVLQSLGISQSEISKRISKTLNISNRKVKDIIATSSYKSLDNDNLVFKEAFEQGLIGSFNYDSITFTSLINDGIKSLNGEMKNICRTTANAASQAYINALDKTYLAIQSGGIDYDTAITNSIKELAKQGISIVEYKSGAKRTVDGAIRNAVRSAVNQTACKCQDKNFEEMGGNLVEVSSHFGARPEHAIWQGKIYWRKEQYKNYSNFELATGYGTGEGLGGWGCRHGFYPYFTGISEKSFGHYKLSENNEYYELTQEQRHNERMIRAWDKRNKVCSAGGIDNSKELGKLREWRNKQKIFLDAHPELKRYYSREKTYKVSKNEHLLAQGLVSMAKNKDILITKDLQNIVSQGSGKLEGLDFRIKGIESLERKLKSKSIEKGITVEEYSKKVTDILRYTNLSKQDKLVQDYFTIVDNLKKKGYNMIEVTNTLGSSSYYRGINTLVEDKYGYVFELQFHTPKSLKIKDVNHKLYEEQRLDTTSYKRKKELINTMRENAETIETPNNIEMIKNIKRKV